MAKQLDYTNPREPKRLEHFAVFFKNYMGVSSLVTAALPIPITAFKLIPTFSLHTDILSTYTTLFCFLMLGYIFYIRHAIAKYFFPNRFRSASETIKIDNSNGADHIVDHNKIKSKMITVVPLSLIIMSLVCATGYDFLMDRTLSNARSLIESAKFDHSSGVDLNLTIHQNFNLDKNELPDSIDRNYILSHYQIYRDGAVSGVLMTLYFGIFLFAETAFILMAMKEYMQDVLKLSDTDLIIPHSSDKKVRYHPRHETAPTGLSLPDLNHE